LINTAKHFRFENSVEVDFKRVDCKSTCYYNSIAWRLATGCVIGSTGMQHSIGKAVHENLPYNVSFNDSRTAGTDTTDPLDLIIARDYSTNEQRKYIVLACSHGLYIFDIRTHSLHAEI